MTALTKNEVMETCEGCVKWKPCKLYVLQDGYASFVCKECREGKRK